MEAAALRSKDFLQSVRFLVELHTHAISSTRLALDPVSISPPPATPPPTISSLSRSCLPLRRQSHIQSAAGATHPSIRSLLSVPRAIEETKRKRRSYGEELVQAGAPPRFDERIAAFVEQKFQRDGIEVCTGFRVIKVSDDLITMKSKSAGEEVSVPYGMAVWSGGIGTHPVIMDFMQQIGQLFLLKTTNM